MDRIISSFFKASSRYRIGFSICIIILAVEAYLFDKNVAPADIFILVWMILCMSVITTIEQCLEGWKTWVASPYWIKKLVVMPIYLAIIVVGISNVELLNERVKLSTSIVLCIATMTYLIGTFVKYQTEKKHTDQLTNALVLLQKELDENEE